MNFKYIRNYPPNIKDFKIVFNRCFYVNTGRKNPGNLNHFTQKMDTSYTGLSGYGLVAYDEEDNPAGCQGFYPVLMNLNNKQILAAQIGDGGVISKYRGRSLLTNMIKEIFSFAKRQDVKLIYVLVNPTNIGSFKSMKNAGFEEIKKYRRISFYTRPFIIARIIRRFNKKLYEIYENICIYPIVVKGKCIFEKYYMSSEELKINRDFDYINYKKYSKNLIIELKKGYAWISVKQFEIIVGYYKCKDGYGFDEFIKSLMKVCSLLGKDQLVFLDHEIPVINNDLSKKINYKDRYEVYLMVYYLDKTLKNRKIQIGYSDFDTF